MGEGAKRTTTDLILLVKDTGHYQEFETCSITDLPVNHQNLPHLSFLLPETIVALLMEAVSCSIGKGAVHMVKYALGLGLKEEHFEARAIPVNDSCVLLLIQNITSHVENEKALRQRNVLLQTVIDTVPPEITAFDEQGRVTIINRAALKNDIPGGDNLESETLNLKPDGKTEYAEDELPLVRAFKGEEVWDQIVIMKREDYYPRTYLVNAVPLKGENGDTSGVLLTERDITEIKNVQHQLQTKIKDFDMFMYRASHDLKSPLTAMQGVIDFACQKTTDVECLNYLRMIRKSHALLAATVNDLIDLTHVSQKEIVKSKVCLYPFLHNITEVLQLIPEATGIKVKLCVQDDAVATTDEGLLKTVLQNLICNGIVHHRPEGDDRFVLVTVLERPRSILIEIEDNGPGIPKKIQDKIYDIFYRANLKVSGSGLGLFIVKQAIEKIGATIELISEEGAGTTFSIVIPK